MERERAENKFTRDSPLTSHRAQPQQPPDFTTCKKHPMGKTALSVNGLQWMPDMQTLTQNGPKNYMEDRNPLDYCKKTQQKCFRTLEWAYISVFVQVSPKTQTGKLKIGKSDFT